MTENMTEIMIAGTKCWIDRNGKVYAVCADCSSFVRMNKTFFGSLHFCTSEEDKEEK